MATAPTAAPEVVETHISTLVLVGERVYKRKKPVRFAFADFSTPEQRRMACHREVALNRRLAPDVYLGVAKVVDEHGHADYLVVMRRLAATDRLATLLVNDPDRATTCLLDAAAIIGRFHATAGRSAAIAEAGTGAHLRKVWDDSTAELAPFIGPILEPAIHDEVVARYRSFIDGREALFSARRAAGHVVDGHGDLRLEDVFCTDEGPRILDCLEFDDQLRHGDVVADLAFVAMDLLDGGRADLVTPFLDAWSSAYAAGGDRADLVPPALLHHHVAARAWVRTKVACLRASQLDAHAAADAAADARRYATLALTSLRAGAPRLVLVGGAPGTGKTTVANALAATRQWPVIHSDTVRKQRAGLPAAGRGPAALYEPAAVAATYVAMRAEAEAHLRLGVSVVLDASWTRADERQETREMAARCGAEVIEVVCRCDPDETMSRVARRLAMGTDASDATPEVASALAAAADPWPEAVEVDTTGQTAGAVPAIVNDLVDGVSATIPTWGGPSRRGGHGRWKAAVGRLWWGRRSDPA
jgi:uncharacterized protein